MPRPRSSSSGSDGRKKKTPQRIHTKPDTKRHETKATPRTSAQKQKPPSETSAQLVKTQSRHGPHSVAVSQQHPPPRKSLDSGFGESSPIAESRQPQARERLESFSSERSNLASHDYQIPARASNPQSVTGTSKLSPLGRRFADITFAQLNECEDFIAENPGILEDAPKIYVAEALLALEAQDEELANQCIHRSLLLRDCNGLTSRGRAEYFDDLRNRRSNAPSRTFKNDFDEAMERLQRLAVTPDPVPQAPVLPGGMAPLNMPMRNRHAVPFPSPTEDGRMGGQTSPYHETNVEVSSARAFSGRIVRGSGVSDGQSYYNPLKAEKIDERYKIYSSEFFTIGKVFATLWHASYGNSLERDSRVYRGRFDEKLISHIQRMVVVKEEHGYCWCVPINTYGRRGVKKFAMRKPSAADQRDIDAHAIIHISTEEPFSPEWEPNMITDPVKVKAAGNDQKLHEMSRVNFAKIHTLEHNVRVMHVGKVVDSCLEEFVTCWRKKALEHPTRAGREPRESRESRR